MRLDSALRKSRSQYISSQTISTLFDSLDEREIARYFSDARAFMAVPVLYYFDWYYHLQWGTFYTKLYYLPFQLYYILTDITMFNAELSTQKYITSNCSCIILWLILLFSMRNFLHKTILPPLSAVLYFDWYYHVQCRTFYTKVYYFSL
jgi:hypothetical protein